MINFEKDKISSGEIDLNLDKSKQKEPETQEISAENKKGENKDSEKDELGIIPIISKVETGEWKSREQIIQDIKEYFDAFVKYILRDGWKKEAIRAMFLYPEEDTFAWIQKDGGYTKNFDCSLYKEYKNHHSRATVNDFDSLIFRLWGLHPEDEQENPISKIGDYFVSVNKVGKDKRITACEVYMSKEELMKSIERDQNIEKKYPGLKESLDAD